MQRSSLCAPLSPDPPPGLLSLGVSDPAVLNAHLSGMDRQRVVSRREWCRKELGHVMLHGPDNVDAAMHRGIAEVEAESVALMVGAAHGLDTTRYTVPYVSTWASDVPGKSPVEVVQATADRVRGASLTILDNLPTTKVGDGNPPGLDRDTPAAHRAPAQPTPAARTHVDALGC